MVSDDPYPSVILQLNTILNPNLANESILYLIGTFVFLFLMIFFSSLFSASENALFSLSAQDKEEMKASDTPSGNAVLKLLSHPKKLLATILVGNNFVNVSFVIVSSVYLETILHPQLNP